jgi:hypothetical protein
VRQGPRTLADLVTQGEPAGAAPAEPVAAFVANGAELAIDDTKAAAAGIRKLQGKHLTLYTDLVPSPDVDDFPEVFASAMPLWCRYFGIAPDRVADWRITGFVMQEKAKFEGTGLLPADLPPFPNGFQRGRYLWLYDQPDAYYRRHLLLHEGTHAFMDQILGDKGPPWYAEGMAELLGTHRWQDRQLTLAYMPQDKSETSGWGRIRIIKDELAAGRGMMPDKILDYGPQAHLRNEPYGWCWGLAAFLDAHPSYQKPFRQLPQHLRSSDLTAWFREQVQNDWSPLRVDWQLFVMNIEYGYDIARAAVVHKPAMPLPPDGATATIAADRGWQSSGILLAAGTTCRIEAAGRYQVGETSQPWWCEPNGVTIHYYQGRPLGMLLAAVSNDTESLTPLARPQPIGLQATLPAPQGGTLYLKINESAAHLSDNRGELTVRVQAAR